MSISIPNTGSLQTESRNTRSAEIDVASTEEICRIINDADASIAPAVQQCIPEIARTIDLIAERVGNGGRVLYVGAGSSGRLGVLDAAEIPPTFSAPYEQFVALMAGGDAAIRCAVEGAEDSTTLPIADLDSIAPPINVLDTLIGIAASGRTPYVLAALTYCRETHSMLTVGVTCVQPSEMRGRADCLIECVVGPEIVTGSTRMKAGTATKMVLNMISTGVMIRIGKTHGNLMIDVKSSNNKLIDRARRIFRTLLPNSSLSDAQIDELIASCGGSVKLAAVVEKMKCSIDEARAKLEGAGGVLRKAWVEATIPPPSTSAPSQLVLAVDAGGTKCTAVIASSDGIQSKAEAGPCNFVTRGHDAALLAMSEVINQAIERLPETILHASLRFQLPLPQTLFAAAWIGGAGLDRPADLEVAYSRISKLLSISDPTALLVTNDAALLTAAIINADTDIAEAQTKTGIVLIAGTGSIAKGFKLSSALQKLVSAPIERSGGWGYLLGDEGSAYSIAREAIRRTLRHRDLGHPPTPFHKRVAAHFGCTTIQGIISAVYTPGHFRENLEAAVLDADPKLRIASLCPIVFAAAFPPAPEERDEEAFDIINTDAKSAVELLLCLTRAKEGVIASESTLVLGGALGQIKEYRDVLVSRLKERGEVFASIQVVSDAAGCAAGLLSRNFLGSSS